MAKKLSALERITPEQYQQAEKLLENFYKSRANTKQNLQQALKGWWIEEFGSTKRKKEIGENIRQQEILDLCVFVLGSERDKDKDLFEPVLYEYMTRGAFGNTYLEVCELRDNLKNKGFKDRAVFLQKSLDNVSNLFRKRVTTLTFTQGSDEVIVTNGYGSTTVHKDVILGKDQNQ